MPSKENTSMRLVAQKLLELQDVFPGEAPESRMEYIHKFDKNQLLQILAAINCYPRRPTDVNYSKDDQYILIDWLFKPRNECTAWWSEKISPIGVTTYRPIFHRAANLVAIEEIICSDLPNTGGESMADPMAIHRFLMYYIAINSLIIQHQDFAGIEELSQVERLISGLAASNELNLAYYPEQDVLRSQHLIDFLANHPNYGELTEAFYSSVGVESNRYSIWGFKYIISIQQATTIVPPVCAPNSEEDHILLEKFSVPTTLSGQSPIETVNVKKSPIWNLGNARYLMLDIPFLVDKGYHSIVNDLWFDIIRPSPGSSRSHFMGEIGNFFEDYVGEIVKFLVPDNSIVRITDELKVNLGEGEIELADFYARHERRVLLGQVKVSAINSRDRYTYKEGQLFRVNKDEFYKAFGLEQLVDTTFHHLTQNPTLFDQDFPADEQVNIYPTLVVNERLLLNPTVNFAFQEAFREKLAKKYGKDIEIPDDVRGVCLFRGQFQVFPVVIIYISELELAQIACRTGRVSLFDLLEQHISNTGLLSSITNTINQNLGAAYLDYLKQSVFPVFRKLVS